MEHNGGITTRLGGMVVTDHRSSLRCGKRAIAAVTGKQFSQDRGHGDCSMHIKYMFRTDDERSVLGQFTATESSFHGIDVGDEIAVRYISKKPHISAPEDTLSIVRPIRKAADIEPNAG